MAEYEADLRMWSRLTSLKPEQHAEAVVFYLGKQKNQIKDKIMTAIGDKLTNNKDGLEEFIKFLKTIYSSDDMAVCKLRKESGRKRKNFRNSLLTGRTSIIKQRIKGVRLLTWCWHSNFCKLVTLRISKPTWF